jgi:hypothetical protein
MAVKKNAVDRVLENLRAEKAGIEATIARLENAQRATAKPRNKKATPPATAAAAQEKV